jgi:hypothetical protein
MTFTPLLGVSSVVKRFLHEKSDDRHKVVMTIDDVEHYSDDDKKTIIASYPAHELEARTKGIPVLGSGRISCGRGKYCNRSSRVSTALASYRRSRFRMDPSKCRC